MDIIVAHDEIAMGRETSRLATQALQQVISAQGEARLLVATGASQLTIFDSLCGNTDVDWSVVDAFHLDEYIGIDQQHSASFCRYLKERFVDRVPLRSFHYLRGDQEVATVMDAANQQILKAPIDLALVGIGENAHLAFNDPPADFTTESPYLIVELDEACRQQQVNEGWFDSLADVPTQAISMSIQQIMKAKQILCSVPGPRKAQAVKDCLEGEVTNLQPSSILQQHGAVTVLLDCPSASMLSPATLDSARTI